MAIDDRLTCRFGKSGKVCLLELLAVLSGNKTNTHLIDLELEPVLSGLLVDAFHDSVALRIQCAGNLAAACTVLIALEYARNLAPHAVNQALHVPLQLAPPPCGKG